MEYAVGLLKCSTLAYHHLIEIWDKLNNDNKCREENRDRRI